MGGFAKSEPVMPKPALSDPRERWRVLYPLCEILLLVLCATLSGMEDFVDIRLRMGGGWRFCAGSCPMSAAFRPVTRSTT
jgi:DDE_Tnp_1-associated